MAQFKSIISSILRDIISAQHEADIFSVSMSEEYAENGRTGSFPLPGAQIHGIEMELRCAINGIEETEGPMRVRYDKVRSFLQDVCAAASEPVVKQLSGPALMASAFFKKLAKSERVSKDYMTFVNMTLNGAFAGSLVGYVNGATGKLLNDKVVERMIAAIKEKIFDDESEDNPFKEDRALKEREAVTGKIKTSLSKLVMEASKGKDFREPSVISHLDVTVNSGELSGLPENTVHLFKLNLTPTQMDVIDGEE